MVIVQSSEYWIIVPWRLERIPYHFEGRATESLDFILIIHSRKPPTIEPHLTEKCCGRCLMSKWINLPSNSWDFPEGFKQPKMPSCHLIDDIFVIRCSFVMHAPATIDELNLFVFNEFTHQFSARLRTVNPPVMKKSNFYLDELSSGIFVKFINNWVYYLLYTYWSIK